MNWFACTAIFLSWVSLGAAEGLRIVEHSVPAAIEAGSETSIPIVLANDGVVPWSPAGGFAVSYHWLNAEGETVVRDGRRDRSERRTLGYMVFTDTWRVTSPAGASQLSSIST